MSITLKAIPENLLHGIIDLVAIQDMVASEEYNSANNITKREFISNLTDEDTLVKTLEDFGIEDITKTNNDILCCYGDLKLRFFKPTENSPYTIEIACQNTLGINEVIKDITSEYSANAQEISYNTIKENLMKKNLLINEEEIYDDDSIVLTVNLE